MLYTIFADLRHGGVGCTTMRLRPWQQRLEVAFLPEDAEYVRSRWAATQAVLVANDSFYQPGPGTAHVARMGETFRAINRDLKALGVWYHVVGYLRCPQNSWLFCEDDSSQ